MHATCMYSCAHHPTCALKPCYNRLCAAQAVWPDMRGTTQATRVAAYSGSLSLTLAFGGFVYVSTYIAACDVS